MRAKNYQGNQITMKYGILIYRSALLSIMLMLGSCSTIVTGPTQTLTFNSTPTGATVSISGKVIGITPITVTLEKQTNQMLTFQKEGYKTYTTPLVTTVNEWFFGNILIGGLLGSTTDAASGSIHKYHPDHYLVQLVPEDESIPAAISKPSADKLTEFVVTSGADIRLALTTGSGESLDALLDMLNVSHSGSESAIKEIKRLAGEYSDDYQWAQAIAQAFLISSTDSEADSDMETENNNKAANE